MQWAQPELGREPQPTRHPPSFEGLAKSVFNSTGEPNEHGVHAVEYGSTIPDREHGGRGGLRTGPPAPHSLVVLPDAGAPAEALDEAQHLHHHRALQEGAPLQEALHLQGRGVRGLCA